MNRPERCFLDTNILVCAYDTSAGNKHIIAKSIVADLWKNQTGCISVQVLQEFSVITSQKVQTPLPFSVIKQIVSDISQWRTHCPVPEDVLRAIDIKDKYHISFWDAMIICSAKNLHCSKLYSEDLNNNQLYEGVRVDNPFLT